MASATLDASAPAPRLGWLKLAVVLLAVLVSAHSLTFLVGAFPSVSNRVGSETWASIDPRDTSAPPGFVRVTTVISDRHLAEAGVRVGDAIRFEHPTDIYATQLRTNQTYRLTIDRNGERMQGAFRTGPPQALGWYASDFGQSIPSLFLILAGLVIALRAPTRLNLLFGASLIAVAQLGSFPAGWQNDFLRIMPISAIWSTIMAMGLVGSVAFAGLQRAAATGRPVSRLMGALFWLYTGWTIARVLMDYWTSVTGDHYPVPLPSAATKVSYWVGYVAAVVLLARGAFESMGEQRTRLGFLSLAMGLYFAGTSGTGMVINLTGNDFSFRNPLAVLGVVFAVAAVIVFLYAALRHRVVDLGFAVNRTLVFGVLSALLLCAFFFLEWGAEQVIPAEMREANLLASAAIAFGLFVVFHKVRDWVEKAVENLFFRAWRSKEAELHRFVRHAPFVTRAETLRAGAVAALSRFAEDAPAALYRREGDAYCLIEGDIPGLSAVLDLDMPALVRLRAEPAPLDDGLPTGAALMLPLVHRHDLSGVFVLGPKPSGELIRPDEREALADAATRIGLDLHALRVEALETESAEQRRRADLLERQMQRALKAGAKVATPS